MNALNEVKKDLEQIFLAAIDVVSGKKAVAREMTEHSDAYTGKYHLIAIGKAAESMLRGVPEDKIINGIVISKHGHLSESIKQDQGFVCLESDHPVPKQASIESGYALLDYIKNLPVDAPCLCLISGGASALVEVLQDGWSLDDLSELTQYLLANAYPIDKINAVRRQISKIKGGGLWRYLGDRPVKCLLISDVPDDNPEDIGSGLLFPAQTKSVNIPQKWAKKIVVSNTPQVPQSFQWKIVASLSVAKMGAADKAIELGYQVSVIPDFLEGDAEEAARNCVTQAKQQAGTLLIWGGETTVHLPEKPGRGGRNQHLALAAALAIPGEAEYYLLAAGTDGSDGNSEATGALVSNKTVSDAKAKGLNPNNFLQNADSARFFEKTGGKIITGATGTNVMDLVLVYSPK